MCEVLRVNKVIEAHELHQDCGFRQAAEAAAAVVVVAVATAEAATESSNWTQYYNIGTGAVRI